MKAILKNNLFAFLIHILMILVLIGIYLLFHIEFSNVTFSWIWAVTLSCVYFCSGYFLSGKLFVKQDKKILNYLSVSSIILVGFLIWLYCLLSWKPNIFFGDIDWVYYNGFFPFWRDLSFTLLSNWGPVSLLILLFIPSTLIWLGIELRQNSIKKI